MRKIEALLVALMLTFGSVAQGRLSGRVTDSTDAPLPFVNIGVVGTTVGTTTNADGRYTLPIAQKDTVTIRFSYTGFRTEEHRILLRGDKSLSVVMRPVATTLQAVEVSDDRTRQTTFTPVDIKRLDDAVGPSGGVESLIKLLPDVQSNNELSSQYSVRGGSFDENLVYLNGVEVLRPVLVRSAQQEGMSLINPDMVSSIRFSPGGFDATYGDRLSSVLDISYSPQTDSKLKGRVSASLLGGSLSLQGRPGERWDYMFGVRRHSNSYLFSAMDTKGAYTTAYTDLQTVVGYHPTDRLDLQALLLATHNRYGLVPESQTTSFGGFFNPMTVRIYFDGQEQDSYATLHGALRATYRAGDDWRLAAQLSAQRLSERECYDVQSQYFLYEVAAGEQAGDTAQFDRGVGTFLEHARNRLQTNVYSLDLGATRYARMGTWQMGLRLQGEHFDDHLREWRWVDSAGYALPSQWSQPGDSNNLPFNPILQQFSHADNGLWTLRGVAYVQRDIGFTTRGGAEVHLTAGVRGQLYRGSHASLTPMASPRLSASLKPRWERDIMFRLTAGVYRQPPFYRELRRTDGSLCAGLPPQTAYAVSATTDWRFRIAQHPFSLTADLYYRYITHLIPYTVDNLRLRYEPDQQAVGYATGISLRLNGELVEGLESWASLSIMRAQERWLGDTVGWIDRPTDQRVSFKLFLQDNIPDIPWWRMSLSLVYGTGTPIALPDGRRDYQLRLPSYYRVDWGNTVRLMEFDRVRSIPWLRWASDVQVGVEVFNLFNFRNVVSYLWVSDYDGRPYRVPNYLTARQLNVKLTIDF